jgi:hypothetical protein
MPDLHQPPSDPSEPDTVEPTAEDALQDDAADTPPVVEGDEELAEVSGGAEITDIGPDAPAS